MVANGCGRCHNMKCPIVLVAYNRPDYFRKTVESLHKQCSNREVFCFIDGPRTGSDKKNVEVCRQICMSKIPKAKIFSEGQNLGIGFIMKKARDTVFEFNDFLILIEDDSVLQPHYIKQLDRLIEIFKDDERIAMMNCFGEASCEGNKTNKVWRHSYLKNPQDIVEARKDGLVVMSNTSLTKKECQELNKDKLIMMSHLWAYAMRKSSWEAIRDITDGYYKLLPKMYHERPHDVIKKYFTKNGMNPNASSQDSCVQSALAARGLIGVATASANFEYIGLHGEHSTPKCFTQAGFAKMEINKEYQHNFYWNEDVFNEIKKKHDARFVK